MNEFTVRLDLAKGKARQQQTVFVRQGDKNATTIVATITDHGAAAATSGMTARFAMRLPNGTEYYRKAASLSGNVATVALDEAQAASVAGRTDVAYFQLLQGSTVVASTESFTVVVLPDALADAEVAESYDSAIQDAIDALDAAVEQMPDMVEDVLEAHPEWTTTVQDGSITKAKLGTDLARDRERLLYRLDNMLTAQLPEGDVATASDAAKTPVAGLALYGRSTQDGTPTPSAPVAIGSVEGNLLDTVRTGSLTDSGVTWTYHADGTITAVGTATANSWSHNSVNRILAHLPAGTYTASVSAPFGLAVYSGSTRLYSGASSSYTFTLSAESDMAVYAMVPNGKTVNATTGIMLTAGSVPYPYAPYQNVGLWTRGRNLLNPAQEFGGATYYTVNADGTLTVTAEDTRGWASLPVAPLGAGTFTLSIDGNADGRVTFRAIDGSSETSRGINGNGSDTFTLTSGGGLRIKVHQGTFPRTVRIQVEAGSTAHAYEPYTSTVTPIDLDGHELRSLPDGTRDELTVDGYGHVTLTQRVGSVTYDGTEGWTLTSGTYPFLAVGSSALGAVGGRPLVSNLLAYTGQITASTDGNGLSLIVDGTTLRIRATGYATADAWKAKLAETPMTVLYPLATPVTHDLGYVAAVPLCGPDLTAQAIPTAPMQLTYERDLNATLARLESAIADVATPVETEPATEAGSE